MTTVPAGGEVSEGSRSLATRAVTRTVLFVGVVVGAWLVGGVVAHADIADPADPVAAAPHVGDSIDGPSQVEPQVGALSTLPSAIAELAPQPVPVPDLSDVAPGIDVLPDLWGGEHRPLPSPPTPTDENPGPAVDTVPVAPVPDSTDAVDTGAVDTIRIDSPGSARSTTPTAVGPLVDEPEPDVDGPPANSPEHAPAPNAVAPLPAVAPGTDSGTGPEPVPADSGTAPGGSGCGSGAPLAVLTNSDGTARPSVGTRAHDDATALTRVIAERPAASPD